MSRAVGIGFDGKRLPHTPAEVDGIVAAALRDGRILAAVLETPDGDIAMPVMGPPSRELLTVLEVTTAAYRRALEEAGL